MIMVLARLNTVKLKNDSVDENIGPIEMEREDNYDDDGTRLLLKVCDVN
jgi:hypothetical protein